MRRKFIEIDGRQYRVAEDLGHQGGHYARVVLDDSGDERVAVSHQNAGPWRFWGVEDKLRIGIQAEIQS